MQYESADIPGPVKAAIAIGSAGEDTGNEDDCALEERNNVDSMSISHREKEEDEQRDNNPSFGSSDHLGNPEQIHFLIFLLVL